MPKDYLLAELRALTARMRLIVLTADTIGTALKTGEITPEQALLWMKTEGLIELCSLRLEAACHEDVQSAPADRGDRSGTPVSGRGVPAFDRQKTNAPVRR